MEDRKVAGIFAHVDAGKTTLTEAILYHAGKIRSLGRVDSGNCFLDTHPIERERGITVFSKQALFTWKNVEYTLLDTPGHVDFGAEMERTLEILDVAVLVIHKNKGIQSHTKTLWRLLRRKKIPIVVFVNKSDLPGSGQMEVLGKLREKLDSGCILAGGVFSGGPGDGFLEELSLLKEEWMEAYLEDKGFKENWVQAARAGFRDGSFIPCYFGSALRDEGVEDFLNGLTELVSGEYSGTRSEQVFGGKVYKIHHDKDGNRLTFLKVTSGSLRVKDILAGPGGSEKVNQIRLYHGTRYETVPAAETGMVCAVTGPAKTRPLDGVGCESGRSKSMLCPMLTAKMVCPQDIYPELALKYVREIEDEMPELKVKWNEVLKEIHVHIMGEIQLEILGEILRERFGIAAEFGDCEVVYKETIKNEVLGHGHFEPLRHFADVHLKLEPLERGSGMDVQSLCREEELDKNYQNLILTHILEKEHCGVLTGSALTDVRITLVSGKAHLKHTEGGDFREATYRAVRQALFKAECILLEPFYAFRIEVPTEHIGRVISDIQRMSGRFETPVIEGGQTVIEGVGPVYEFREYPRDILSFTRGKGSVSFRFYGYEPCHNAEAVKARIGYDRDKDIENPAGSIYCSHGAGYYVPWDEV